MDHAADDVVVVPNGYAGSVVLGDGDRLCRRGAPRGRFVVRQPERLQDLASKRAQAGRRSGCRDSNPDFRTGSPAVCHSTSIRAKRMYPRGRCCTASTALSDPQIFPARSHGAGERRPPRSQARPSRDTRCEGAATKTANTFRERRRRGGRGGRQRSAKPHTRVQIPAAP